MKHILIEDETHRELMFCKLLNSYKNIDQTVWELIQNEKRRITQESN